MTDTGAETSYEIEERTLPAAVAENKWRSRIVGYGEEAPDQLLAHPLNRVGFATMCHGPTSAAPTPLLHL